MKVVIIKYNAGNIKSVALALERLGVKAEISDDIEIIKEADKLIFPGVGEASTTMNYLRKKKLNQLLPTLTQPVLGICLGMQLLCNYSMEGKTPCIGIFDELIERFPAKEKIPHVGWNQISGLKGPLFKNIPDKSYVYFVHSYFANLSQYSIADSDYIMPFTAAMQKNNFYATQFHPERSGKIGEIILKNFIEL